MAHCAKVAMSGECIGKLACKIGFGKVTPSKCLWIGGLGPWSRIEKIEREFDRFGVINAIEWPAGKTYAYILYGNLEAAQAACTDMRGGSKRNNDQKSQNQIKLQLNQQMTHLLSHLSHLLSFKSFDQI